MVRFTNFRSKIMTRTGNDQQPHLYYASLLLLLLLTITSTNARIHELTISGDSRSAFHIESFGFNANGVAELCSVTVSIGELTKGRFNVIFLVSFVVRSTSVLLFVVVVGSGDGVGVGVGVKGRRGEERRNVMK